MDGSASICDEVIDVDAKLSPKDDDEEIKTIPLNFNEKKVTCKTQNIYILFAFLSITIVLLRAVSIYCYLREYQPKQRYLLSFHNTNNKIKI